MNQTQYMGHIKEIQGSGKNHVIDSQVVKNVLRAQL